MMTILELPNKIYNKKLKQKRENKMEEKKKKEKKKTLPKQRRVCYFCVCKTSPSFGLMKKGPGQERSKQSPMTRGIHNTAQCLHYNTHAGLFLQQSGHVLSTGPDKRSRNSSLKPRPSTLQCWSLQATFGV